MQGKWQNTNVTKAILLAVAHIMVIVMTVSFLWVIAYPALRMELFQGKPAKQYQDTKHFANELLQDSIDILNKAAANDILETNGKFDDNKIVDVEYYYKENEITGKDENGWAYRLEDLVRCYLENREIEEEGESPSYQKIIVCKKTDGTYRYYRFSEFSALMKEKKYSFIAGDSEELTMGEILEHVEMDGSFPIDNRGITTKKGKLVYSDCWVFEKDDKYSYQNMFDLQTTDSKDIIQIANEQSKWNGKLSDACKMLDATINSLGYLYENSYEIKDQYREGDTNLAYMYVNMGEKKVYTNREAYALYDNVESTLKTMKDSGKYVIVKPKLADFETNIKGLNSEVWRDSVEGNELYSDDYIFAINVDTNYPIQDSYYSENELYAKHGAGVRTIAVLGVVAVFVFVGCLIWLIAVAGKNSKHAGVQLNIFDHWKTELAAVSVIAAWFIPILVEEDVIGILHSFPPEYSVTDSSYVDNVIPFIIVGCIMASYTCTMFLTGLLSLVRRIKARTLWSNSIMKMVISFVQKVVKNINLIWKTALVFFAMIVIQLYISAVSYIGDVVIVVFIIPELIILTYLLYVAIGREQIKKGIFKISAGELDYKVPTDKLKGNQKEIAEAVNTIGDGLEKAIAKSLKNERLKTDLITNVSHDIKTPLTSIINYVGLLKAEKLDNPRVDHYIEVLEQKAQRLKTLTEDVVEASKVSSGNINLEYVNLNFAEMIQQVSGEIEEKFQARNLTEVLKLPEEDVVISVDGRRTWRILENIYNNAAKYAMMGTRVYAELKVVGDEAEFSLKNISEQQLNITADELTERFIRGDLSRSTEGSGLGLSIARTLTEMQGGKFELYLDGDLFKAIVRFKLVKQE